MEWLRGVWSRIPLFWRLAGTGLLLALGVVALIQGRPDGRLHLFFLPVGQGNGVLVVSPSGRTVLVDGGPDGAALLAALGRRLPFWSREIDLVLLTETTAGRMAGPLAALERYRARAAGRPVRPVEGAGWERWVGALARSAVEPVPLQRGVRLELGDGVTIEVLYPGAEPAAGVRPAGRDDAPVLRLCYGGFCALFPTAVGPAGRRALLGSKVPLAATLLLVPRQAEDGALDNPFLQAIEPDLAVVSAGSGRFEGPSARVLDMLAEAGVAVYRTDRQGTVEVVTDGQAVWVRTER